MSGTFTFETHLVLASAFLPSLFPGELAQVALVPSFQGPKRLRLRHHLVQLGLDQALVERLQAGKALHMLPVQVLPMLFNSTLFSLGIFTFFFLR